MMRPSTTVIESARRSPLNARPAALATAIVVALMLLTATGPASEAAIVIDDGEDGFSVDASWSDNNSISGAFRNDLRFVSDGGGTFATWSFTGLDEGLYDVLATWRPQSNRSTDAPFLVEGRTAPVNQREDPAPDVLINDGTGVDFNFQRLDRIAINADGGSITVQLSDDDSADGNSYVIADAVAVVLVPEPSTFALGLGGVGVLLVRRRRAV